jgi:FkbM family methyltransferase
VRLHADFCYSLLNELDVRPSVFCAERLSDRLDLEAIRLTQSNVVRTPFDDGQFVVLGSSDDRSVVEALRCGDGIWEPHVMQVMKRYVSVDHVCFDIGANLGIHTLVMSKLAPEGSVVAFEASRQNFTFLLRNIEENGLRNVSPHHCALWNTEGRLSLTFVNELAGCAFVGNDDVSGSGLEKIRSVVTADWAQTTAMHVSEEAVDCIRLDAWVAKNEVPRLDFIKLDVEGAEALVLEGAAGVISRFHPLLITEYNPACAVKYFGASESAYFGQLSEIFPFRYLIQEGGQIMRIDRYDTLREILRSRKGWEDLLCSFKELN